jgi:hypothetical protein
LGVSLKQGAVVAGVALGESELRAVRVILLVEGHDKGVAVGEEGGDGEHRVEAAEETGVDEGLADLGLHREGGEMAPERCERFILLEGADAVEEFEGVEEGFLRGGGDGLEDKVLDAPEARGGEPEGTDLEASKQGRVSC